jgi:hypothetical protein
MDENRRYRDAAIRDSCLRGEQPFASHRMYDGPLDDLNPSERNLGIVAGFAWGELAEKRIVYVDLGVTRGMEAGIREAERLRQPVEIRRVPGWRGRGPEHVSVALGRALLDVHAKAGGEG